MSEIPPIISITPICMESGKRSIDIVINYRLQPWCAPKMGKYGVYADHAKYKSSLKKVIEFAYKDAMKGKFLEGALKCDLTFYTSRKVTAKPDRTNLCKLMEDIFEGIFFQNDSYIVSGNVQKVQDKQEKIEAHIEEL